MTINEVKRVINLRMNSAPIGEQEKAGLNFTLGLLDMIVDTAGQDESAAKTKQDEDENAAGHDENALQKKPNNKIRKIPCKRCGKIIESKSNRTMYCEDCRLIVKREQSKASSKRAFDAKVAQALDEMEDARTAAEELARM